MNVSRILPENMLHHRNTNVSYSLLHSVPVFSLNFNQIICSKGCLVTCVRREIIVNLRKLQMMVPDNMVGLLIGRGGENITR
jgi:hypothetical protein